MEYDNELEAAAFETPSDLHHFAKMRMISVGDPGFSWLFVGSMSPFQGATEWFGDQHRIPADAPRRRGAENAASPVWKALNDAMPLDRPSRLNGG